MDDLVGSLGRARAQRDRPHQRRTGKERAWLPADAGHVARWLSLSLIKQSSSDREAIADILSGIATGVMRSSAALVVGGLAVVILVARFDWAPTSARIALVCGLFVALLLLSFLQGIS